MEGVKKNNLLPSHRLTKYKAKKNTTDAVFFYLK